MKKHTQKVQDHTMAHILIMGVVCFIMGISLLHIIGNKQGENIQQQQSYLLHEQQLLQREIQDLEQTIINPRSPDQSFVEVKMTVNKKNLKQKTIHQKIDKPIIDKKEYKYITLQNKLKVLVVRDPDSKMGSAALNVNAGSWNEPDEFPGLAHFLEHMLFQGSETYPQTSYFEKLVASGGGYTNAYTQGTKTNYYFEIETSKYLDTLNVFAHFFIDPLLSPDMVQKEANAVNSEYEINVSGDGWKLLHLISLMSKEGHPMSRFTIGNLDSLIKPNIVDALKQFHKDFYSSNQMALVVRSNVDVDRMIEFIKESEFNKIPNYNLQKPTFTQFGLPLKDLGSAIKYHINQKTSVIYYIYQLQDDSPYYRTKPIEFINSIVKSKHQGGLYNFLIDKKYVVDLDASPFLGDNGAFMFYLIEAELPKTIIGDTTDIAQQIGQAIISYFDEMIKTYYDEEFNPTQLLKDTYENKKNLREVRFKYSEKEQDIFKLSHNLNTYPSKNILNGDTLYFEFNAEIIYNYLADFINTQNMIIMIGDDGYQMSGDSKLEEVELNAFITDKILAQMNQDDQKFLSSKELSQTNQLYQVQYEVKSLSKETLDYIAADGIDLKLPQVNKYVPTNLAFKSLCLANKVSYIEKIDSDTMYDRNHRANLFIEEKQVPFFFTSEKECKKREFEYENYNHFPQLVQKNLQGKTWWRLDRSYSPNIYVGLTFDTALEMKSLKRTCLIQIFNSYVGNALQESLQESFEAGYELSFDSNIRGLSLEMYGWSDKFEYFYKNVLTQIKQEASDSERLQRVKTALIMDLANAYEQKLFIQGISTYLPSILQNTPTPNQLIEEIQKLEANDVVEFQKELVNNFRFTTYFTGNVLREEVSSMTNLIKQIFDESTTEIRFGNHQSTVADLYGKSVVFAQVSKSTNNQDMNGLTVNYYQIGHRDQKQYSLMNLLQKQLNNAAYSYLRTQLQLGYVVSVRFRPVGCIDSAIIVVQGTAKPPYEVNKYIETFLINYGEQLKKMTDEQFQDIKWTTISQMKDNVKSLKEKAKETWSHIKFNDLAFEEKEVAASIMEQITKQELFDFYDRVFQSGKLSLQVYGQGMASQMDFNNILEQKQLNKDLTFSKRDEQTLFTQEDFKTKFHRNYNCNYRISNV